MRKTRRALHIGAASALAVWITVLAPTVPPKAAESRDKVRLDLLDTCVANEWKVRSVKDKIVDECKCAATHASRKLSQAQVDAFADQLAADLQGVWVEATKACFTSVSSVSPTKG